MAVRVTPAQARRMGVDVPASTPKRVARAPYHTRCMACGAVFTTQAAEDSHVDTLGGHNRFELVLTYAATS